MTKLDLHLWYRQYLQLKSAYPDTVLFYRLGDFYEVFDDDAKLAATLLDVTLTRKEKGIDRASGEKLYAPMAGMPYRAVESYVVRLVGAGYRVAIAEQVAETSANRSDTRPRSIYASGIEQRDHDRRMKLVDREVVRIITPGTLIESSLLNPGQHIYLAAAIAEGDRIGFAYTDLSTGDFQAIELEGPRARFKLEGELARLQVAEVLVPDDDTLQLPGLAPARARLEHDLAPMTRAERELLPEAERIARRLDQQESAARWTNGHVTALPNWRWDLATAREALLRHFRAQSLAAFGLQDRPLAIRAAGATLQYVIETQRGAVGQITGLRYYTLGDSMFLDPQTRRNLELLRGAAGGARGSLLRVINYTTTPMGARLLEDWLGQPLLNLRQLRARQEAVARLVADNLLRAELREGLRPVGDMERVVNRLLQGVAAATPRELTRLREALRALPRLAELVGDVTWLTAVDQVQEHQGAASSAPTGSAGPHAVTAIEHDLDGDDDLFDEVPASRPAGVSRETAHVQPEPATQPAGNGSAFDTCSELLAYLEEALDDEPPAVLGAANYLRDDEDGRPRRVIRPGFDDAMDTCVAASRDAQRWIDQLESKEKQRTGIKSLKVGYNQVFGYYIELARSAADVVPAHYVRKQTLVGAERYVTPELKEYENIVLTAQERLRDLERGAFERICQRVIQDGARLLAVARLLARIDVFGGLAEAAVRGRYVRPTLTDSLHIKIVAGRHPVVEQTLAQPFVPNDLTVDGDEQRTIIITGPNMSGKSTLMRQVALIVLLAQIGSFVPADEAEIGICDRIFTRIGAQDDIATGQSTFMVEMTETAAILSQATPRSLVILDEVGRGTSTYDGMAIARALLEYMHTNPALRCRTLFATHYHELTALEQMLSGIKNYHVAAIEQDGEVVFLHELRRGGADRSYGIHVAEIAGVPRSVIARARELLAELEQHRTAAGADSRAAPGNPRQLVEPPGPLHRRRPSGTSSQLPLFAEQPHPVVEALRRINVNEITPIEALLKLAELQRLAR